MKIRLIPVWLKLVDIITIVACGICKLASNALSSLASNLPSFLGEAFGAAGKVVGVPKWLIKFVVILNVIFIIIGFFKKIKAKRAAKQGAATATAQQATAVATSGVEGRGSMNRMDSF